MLLRALVAPWLDAQRTYLGEITCTGTTQDVHFHQEIEKAAAEADSVQLMTISSNAPDETR